MKIATTLLLRLVPRFFALHLTHSYAYINLDLPRYLAVQHVDKVELSASRKTLSRSSRETRKIHKEVEYISPPIVEANGIEVYSTEKRVGSAFE